MDKPKVGQVYQATVRNAKVGDLVWDESRGWVAIDFDTDEYKLVLVPVTSDSVTCVETSERY